MLVMEVHCLVMSNQEERLSDIVTDLCNKHKVTGYPQMMMYKNGEMVSQFKGPREWSSLISFINEHAPSTTQSTKQATPEKEKSDHIATGPNAEGMVKILDESTFNSMLGDGPVFVKFYAPWYEIHSHSE